MIVHKSHCFYTIIQMFCRCLKWLYTFICVHKHGLLNLNEERFVDVYRYKSMFIEFRDIDVYRFRDKIVKNSETKCL